MANNYGIGYFTAENLAAVLRALPETDGTYAEVVKRARDYEADVSRYLLGKWVATGRRDRKAGNRASAYARFAEHFEPAQGGALHGRRESATRVRAGATDTGAHLRVRPREDGAARRLAR